MQSNERRGRDCRSEVDAARGSTALLDLRGQARPVFIEFIVWNSTEYDPGFIPHNAIGLYSMRALAPLTRDDVQRLASDFLSNFDNSNAAIVRTQLTFRESPDGTGVSLVFGEGDALAGVGRVNIRMRTTRSIFGDFGNNAPNYSMASASDIMNTPIGTTTVRHAISEGDSQERFNAFMQVRATDEDLSAFNAGCTMIQNRVSDIGLTGADQYVALWAAIRQHPGYQADPAHFAETVLAGKGDAVDLISQ